MPLPPHSVALRSTLTRNTSTNVPSGARETCGPNVVCGETIAISEKPRSGSVDVRWPIQLSPPPLPITPLPLQATVANACHKPSAGSCTAEKPQAEACRRRRAPSVGQSGKHVVHELTSVKFRVPQDGPTNPGAHTQLPAVHVPNISQSASVVHLYAEAGSDAVACAIAKESTAKDKQLIPSSTNV